MKAKEQAQSSKVDALPLESDPLLIAKTDNDEHEATVMETVFETIVETANDFKNDVVDELDQVADAFVEEMQDADDGENFFLEMSLARNFSILPADIMQAAADQAEASLASKQIEQTDEELQILGPHEQETAGEPVSTTLAAYLMLASAVVALSSIGPLLDLQSDCTPVMKIYWRMSATAFLLFPMALLQVRREGLPRLSCPQWTTFLMAAACYATMCTGFVMALKYTAVGNAVILANSQAILLLFGKFFVGQAVLVLEGSGAVAAFGGAILCSQDSSENKPDNGATAGNLTILGDFLALIAGLGGVGYLIFAKTVRAHMGLYTFMFLIMSVGSLLVLLFQTLVLQETVSLDRNQRHGVWGWMNPTADRLPLELTMVVVCNLIGSVGYIRSMQYFDNLVISVAALMEPVVAEFMAFLLGVGFLPGWKGWLGNALVALGTLAVIAPSAKAGKAAGH